MARKVVVPDDNKSGGTRVKKKRSKCCTCCITALITSIVLLAIAFTVGWFLGDKYLKQNFGVTMKETWSVFTGLYGTKDKDVVTNPYNASDLDGFYSEIKTNILLKSDADVDFKAALNEAIQGYLGGSSADAANAKNIGARNEGEPDGSDTQGGESKGEIMDIFVDMIADVFTRENIDVERLKQYSEDNDNYIFALRDKQLAAFVASILDTVLDNAAKVDMLSGFGDMINFKKVVALKQIRFGATATTNELGEKTVSATTADVTVWIGLQDAVGQALKVLLNEAGVGWAGGIAAWVGNVILPKNLYATITMPLYGDATTDITLNDMTAKKRESMYKLINGVLGSMGGSQTIQDILGGFAEQIKPILEKSADAIDFSGASNGEIGIDLLGSMANMINNSDSVDPLTKADFMYLLQVLLTSDLEARKSQLQPYLYEGWYRSADDKLAYNPDDKTGYEEVDYREELRKEIVDKYCLDKDTPLNDLFSMMGISLGGSSSSSESGNKRILDWMDSASLNAKLDAGKATEDFKLTITDRMLGALFSDQMSSIVSAGAGYEDLELILDAMSFTKRQSRRGHMYASLAVEIDMSALLDFGGEGSALGKMASNIMPERILFTVSIDITGATPDSNLPAGEMPDDPIFMFNDFENTARVFDTLGKIMPDLDLDGLTVNIEKALKDMIAQLNGKFEIKLVPSDLDAEILQSGEMHMPDIFTIMTGLVLVDENNVDPETGKKNTVVTADEFKNVLTGLNVDENDIQLGEKIADNYNSFRDELSDKYYLNTTNQDIEKFSDLTRYIDGDITGSRFNITGDDKSVKYLAYDARNNSALHPILTGGELGLIITENLGTSVENFAVESVETFGDDGGDSGIVAQLSIATSDLFPGEVKTLLSAEKLYITARIVTSRVDGTGAEGDPKRHPITYNINNMDEATRDNTVKIAKHFSTSFDLDAQIKEFGTILYDQLQSLNKSLGGNDENSFTTFTDDGVELKSFYEFLANKLGMPNEDPNTVKEAVQGMYAQSEITELLNANNYNTNDFVLNETPLEDRGVFDKEKFTAAKSANGEVQLPKPGDKGTPYTDTQFNDFLDGQVVAMSPGEYNGVKALQTVILKAGDNSDTPSALRRWLNSNGKLANSPIDDGKDYMLITFEMDMGSYAKTGDSNSVQSLLPESVYATIVFERIGDESTEFRLVNENGLVFNAMSHNAYEVLAQLMGIDATDMETVNITTVTAMAEKLLNGFCYTGTIDFETSGGNGVGIMQFTYKGIPSLNAIKASVYNYSFI